MKQIIEIKGMSCSHCVAHVKQALLELTNTEDVVVDLEKNNAVIEGSKAVEEELIISAIEEAGYEVNSIKII